jgi:hypothetical protein
VLAVLASCAAAAASYWSPISDVGFIAFLVPTMLLAAASSIPAALRGAPASGLPLALAVAVGWAVAVNLLAGQDNGPAARSAFYIGVGTVLAVAAAGSDRPALFLAPLMGILAGGLAGGSAGTGEAAAVVCVALAVVALAWVDSDRAAWAARPPRIWFVPTAAVIAAAGAAAFLYLQGYDWPEVVVTAPMAPPDVALWLYLLIALAGLVAVASVAGALRFFYVRSLWRRARRRLEARQPPAAGVAGAWRWTRARIALYGLPLPVHLAPDLAARGELPGVPVKIAKPLRQLADLAVPAAFAAEGMTTVEDARDAWQLADDVVRRSRDRVAGWGRVKASLSGVGGLH